MQGQRQDLDVIRIATADTYSGFIQGGYVDAPWDGNYGQSGRRKQHDVHG